MAGILRKGLIIVSGAVVFAGSVSVIKWWRTWVQHRSRKLEQRIEDGIGMEQLALLAKSSNGSLRRSAEQLLLDRITQIESFKFVMSSCYSKDEEQVLKACTVFCVILKSVDYRSRGMDRAIITTLSHCLLCSIDRSGFDKLSQDTSAPVRIQRMILAAIFDFLCDLDEKKDLLLNETDSLAAIVKLVEQTRSREVLRYGVFLLHQIAKHASAQGHLIQCEAVPVFASLAVSHHGDNVLQKLCFQMLVILLNTPGLNSEVFLKQIAKQRVLIRAAVSCKSEDGELAYWAVALLHEYAIHSSTKQYLYDMPFLLGNLQKALTSNPAQLQRLILRVISFMALHHDQFKSEVLDNAALMEHLPVCLASGETDVVHWGLVLLHDLAVAGSDQDVAGKSSLEKLLGSSDDALIKAMIPLSVSKEYTLVRLLAETLGFFCSCEQLHLRLVKAGVLPIILGLAMTNDSDLAFWAAALLLNLAMTSDAVKFSILKAGSLQALVELALSDHENSQVTTMAAKTLVMLGFTEKPLRINFHSDNESGCVSIHGENYHLNNPGITVMVWDTLVSWELVCQNFNKENCDVIPELTLDIPSLQESGRSIGNLVFITVRGKHCTAYLQGMKEVLHFSDSTSFSGVRTPDPLQLGANHVCAIVSRLEAPNKLDVWHIHKSIKPIDLQLQYGYGDIVNYRVQQLILSPLLKGLESVPAHSSISRVSDLELLEIFACHKAHLPILKGCSNLVNILTDMIWYCAVKGLERLESEPLALAHCLGALRVLSVLATYDDYKPELLAKETARAIVSLLFNLVNIWLSSAIGKSDKLNDTGKFEANCYSTPIGNGKRPASRGNVLGTGGVLSDELDGDTFEGTTDSLLKTQTLEDTISSLGSMVHQLAHSTSQQGRDTGNLTSVDSAVYTELPSESRTDDHHIMYSRVAKYGALILSSLAFQQNMDVNKIAPMNLAGASHILWATLLSCAEELKQVIALPVSFTLTQLIQSTDFPSLSDDYVVLDPTDKTSSLMLSSDCLVVRNDSWTFESIRTNHSLPKTCSDEVAGWYYEVTLMSNGIIQIGWATKDCPYGPEKGVGVGDFINSCAFDGARCKIWNGPVVETLSNDYGTEWSAGDVVSCLMDRHGNASFWLCGVDMGVAFKGLDLSQGWYPACSVSTEQQLRFNFGDTLFRYGDHIPVGFVPVCKVRTQKDLTITKSCTLSENTNNNATDTLRYTRTSSQNDAKYLAIDTQKASIEDSIDEVCPVLSPHDDTSMAEFGYSGIQGEECAESATAMGDPQVEEPITDELFEEGGEEPVQLDDHEFQSVDRDNELDIEDTDDLFGEGGEEALQMEDLEFQPMEGGDVESHDVNRPISDRQLSSAGAAGGENPVPSLYYEVIVTKSVTRPLVLGYCGMDGLDDQVCACLVRSDNYIVLPDESLIPIQVEDTFTIGCGLLAHTGTVFFTVNDLPLRHLFNFSQESAGQTPLMPCTNDPYLRINYGQDVFTYGPANHPEQRLAMAALLHDFHQNRMVKLTQCRAVVSRIDDAM